MQAGLIVLVLAYVLSQFYRVFLAVLAQPLMAETGVTAAQLSTASGLWFLAFAAMQIPVGEALDRVGPRRTAAVLLGVAGAGGAALFAVATGPGMITAAMILLGIGCSPVLMAAFYIFARAYPPARFATLGGLVIGLGSLGNIAGSAPLATVTEVIGWRPTMAGLAGVTALAALALAATLRDPPPSKSRGKGSVLDLLRIRALWFILPLIAVNYAPSAALRGLWISPYVTDIFGADAAAVARITLIMSLAMVLGSFTFGPLERLFGTRKWLAVAGACLTASALLTLWALPAQGIGLATAMAVVAGFGGASFALLSAHARATYPEHLTGRGVTLANLFGIGGVGVLQVGSARLFTVAGPDPAMAYPAIFLLMGLLPLAGLALYLFSTDRTD